MRKPMIRMDLKRAEVYRGGKEAYLTPNEFRILETLAKADGIVATRNVLARKVGIRRGSDIRAIDQHIVRIRRKLGTDSIKTITGFGYKTRMVKLLD